MHKLASLLVLLGMCMLPALAANETFKDVSLIDSNCSKKAAADPDSHTRECALKCQASGYGIRQERSPACRRLRRSKGRHPRSHFRQTPLATSGGPAGGE